MLDIKFIRENQELVKQGLANKNTVVDLDLLLAMDKRRRELISQKEILQAEQNKKSKNGPKDPVELEALKNIKNQIKLLHGELSGVESKLEALLYTVPNLPLESVPVGKSGAENQVLREVGAKKKFGFKPLSYIELGEKLDLIDTERAAKVSGTRFGYLKHEGAIMEFALVQLALSLLINKSEIAKIIKNKKLNILPKSFIPVVPPVLIKPESMKAMGYSERGGDEIYFLEKDQLYLVGTSEQSVGPMHMDESFERSVLPHRHISFSTCFRREAGSYGKDTKGILRVHQFDKLEMFVTCTPETALQEHELLLGIEEKLMQLLGLPYRVLNICTGDLGDPAASKYDIEAWLPGQNNGEGEYRETHSTSNTTDYQARRLNVKIKSENVYTHMLNGTAFAIGRTILAIIENYQTKKGTIIIPKALRKYMFGIKEIQR